MLPAIVSGSVMPLILALSTSACATILVLAALGLATLHRLGAIMQGGTCSIPPIIPE